jgi:diacylglycerol O-acyltransferase
MAYTHYERLSAMDAMFLEIEDASVPMHIGSVALFENGPLRDEDGGLDFARVFAFAEARIHKSPRLRQRLAEIPVFGRPVWVDDARFNLPYHLRHAALPKPGSERQLKRLAGRILSQQLDRKKPLWETWFIEGVEGERFAVISKLHHCMADGVSSGNMTGMMMGTKPDFEPDPAPTWIAREPPDGLRMALDEATRRVTGPLSLLRSAGQRGETGEGKGGDLLASLRQAARGAWRAAEAGLRPASETPLNVEIGPHRRFDWSHTDLGEVKRVARAAGGTVNDVALAAVAGAVRSFLERRGVSTRGIDFRAAVPVNARTESDEGRLGNRVSSLIASLPVEEPDPRKRLVRVVEATRSLKRSGESEAVDLLGRLADWLPVGVMAGLSRAGSHAVNMVVTNVPGPEVPVYMLGAAPACSRASHWCR